MNNLFKVFGLIGGGILALGTGAVGTHFAHPTLEKNFFPERINEENKLKESLDDVNEQIDKLANDLESKREKNETQETTISKLGEEVKELEKTVSKKEDDLKNKEKEIENKQNQINGQIEENNRQKTQIDDLNIKYSAAEQSLTTAKKERDDVQSSLIQVQTRLSLKREDILINKGLQSNSLQIKTKKVEKKKFEKGLATFSADNGKGETKEFSIKKPDGEFLNYEAKARELQKTGISFKLHESFKQWDTSFQVITYVLDYFYKTTDQTYKKKFVLKDSNSEATFKISDYFKQQYWEDAFRVLIAMGQFTSNNPLCRNFSGSYDLEFCDDSKISFDFSENKELNLDAFSATEANEKKMPFWTNDFKTHEDFINYWINKTIDFIRTGTVDLLDFMNPILFEKNYK